MGLKIKSFFIYLLLVGCSNTVTLESNDPGNIGNQVPVNFDIQASVVSGPYEGRTVLNNVRNSFLEVQIPLGMNSFVPVGFFQSSSLNIQGQVTTDVDTFKTLRINVPYSYVLRGVNSPTTTQLPNGESLIPYFQNVSSVPSTSFNLDPQGQVLVHLYSSPPNFGVFIQTPFELSSSRPYQVNLGNSFTQIGSVSTHAHLNNLNGGLFLFISLPQ